MSSDSREFEVVVWGASGFTGRLVAEYLLEKYGASNGFRWAIGGRNPQKMESVRRELAETTGRSTDALPILIGNSEDADSLLDLARRTRVMCTTVGPYAKYGSKLVEACARTGTSYCDLTGEVHWMQRMIEAHEDAARASGARIVFNCGFDCIPSNIGCFFMQREMKRTHGTACTQIQLRVEGFSGAASGGTIASMLNMLEESEADPNVRRAMADPYSLNPKGNRTGPDRPEPLAPRYDPDFAQWVAPFVMAGINTKVVRRSNALLGYAYGKNFRYDEAMLMGSGPGGFAKALVTSAGSMAAMGSMAWGPLRRVAAGRLPQPGEGPSRAKREAGYFDLVLRGVSGEGHVLNGRVKGDRDPGYGATSKMLAESSVALARDSLGAGGGVWTPASALGEVLLDRLPEAGVRFEIEE